MGRWAGGLGWKTETLAPCPPCHAEQIAGLYSVGCRPGRVLRPLTVWITDIDIEIEVAPYRKHTRSPRAPSSETTALEADATVKGRLRYMKSQRRKNTLRCNIARVMLNWSPVKRRVPVIVVVGKEEETL